MMNKEALVLLAIFGPAFSIFQVRKCCQMNQHFSSVLDCVDNDNVTAFSRNSKNGTWAA